MDPLTIGIGVAISILVGGGSLGVSMKCRHNDRQFLEAQFNQLNQKQQVMERELDVVKSETGTYIDKDTPRATHDSDPYYNQPSPSEQTQYQKPIRSNWKKIKHKFNH